MSDYAGISFAAISYFDRKRGVFPVVPNVLRNCADMESPDMLGVGQSAVGQSAVGIHLCRRTRRPSRGVVRKNEETTTKCDARVFWDKLRRKNLLLGRPMKRPHGDSFRNHHPRSTRIAGASVNHMTTFRHGFSSTQTLFECSRACVCRRFSRHDMISHPLV